MRRHPFLALVAVVISAGAVLLWPSLDHDTRTPAPAGAVLQATADAPTSPAPPASARPTSAALPASPAPHADASPGSQTVTQVGSTTTADPSDPSGPSAAAVRPTRAGSPGLDGETKRRAEPDAAPDPRTLTGYRWPVSRVRITNPFGPSWYGALWVGGERFHDGLDLATVCGDHVVAAHSGIVLAVGRKFDPYIGWIGSLAAHTRLMDQEHHWSSLPIVIVIDDGNGYRSIYAHFNAVAVKVGQRVRAGQFIGWEGATGFASGCHVHYGLFSPYATERFRLRPDVQKKTRYPKYEIARIDPLVVLPPRPRP